MPEIANMTLEEIVVYVLRYNTPRKVLNEFGRYFITNTSVVCFIAINI